METAPEEIQKRIEELKQKQLAISEKGKQVEEKIALLKRTDKKSVLDYFKRNPNADTIAELQQKKKQCDIKVKRIENKISILTNKDNSSNK